MLGSHYPHPTDGRARPPSQLMQHLSTQSGGHSPPFSPCPAAPSLVQTIRQRNSQPQATFRSYPITLLSSNIMPGMPYSSTSWQQHRKASPAAISPYSQHMPLHSAASPGLMLAKRGNSPALALAAAIASTRCCDVWPELLKRMDVSVRGA